MVNKETAVGYTGINHMAMATRDMDTTLRFWRDLLGMRLVACLGRPGYRHYFLEISPLDMIAFFEWPDVEPAVGKDHGVPVKGPFVFDHVSIGVETDDDLWIIKDKLEAAEIWVSELIDHDFIHSIYTFDPNQIAVEFSAPTALNIRKTPIIRDPDPSATVREGLNPRPGHWPEPSAPTPPDQRILYRAD